MTNSSTMHIVNQPIAVICTGGTFDKTYDPISESLVLRGNLAAERILLNAQVSSVNVSAVIQKDSLDLTEQDLKIIFEEIESLEEDRVVVVHGTSRLIEIASRVDKISRKTVIFTGSMVPAAFELSEASFNLGFALASARLLDSGVWIAMSGEIFRPNEVIKNTTIGRFERSK